MDIREIRQLIKLMVDNGLTELDIAEGENKVSLKRGVGGTPVVMAAPLVAAPAPAAAAAPVTPEKPAEKFLEIKSPMVGTFYAAPSPDSPPFAKVGDLLGPDSVACIVEAMKVMNEIKAECAGAVVEVCVQNAQPVEYGQVLFRVRPS